MATKKKAKKIEQYLDRENKIGKWVRTWREQRQLSLSDFAVRLGHKPDSGKIYCFKIENGEHYFLPFEFIATFRPLLSKEEQRAFENVILETVLQRIQSQKPQR